jgi:hypothetical protein
MDGRRVARLRIAPAASQEQSDGPPPATPIQGQIQVPAPPAGPSQDGAAQDPGPDGAARDQGQQRAV